MVKGTPPSGHTEIGTVSLPASSRYIGLDFPTLRRNWFHPSSLSLFASIAYWTYL